mgnify:CR=1 FL=1
MEMLEEGGPVQSARGELAGWQGPGDYWFPEIRSLAGAIAGMSHGEIVATLRDELGTGEPLIVA